MIYTPFVNATTFRKRLYELTIPQDVIYEEEIEKAMNVFSYHTIGWSGREKRLIDSLTLIGFTDRCQLVPNLIEAIQNRRNAFVYPSLWIN
jgi:hypothetical protein